MKCITLMFSIGLIISCLSGCASLKNPAETRRKHIEDFSKTLEQRYAQKLASSLTLSDCLEIAFKENYDLKKSELEQRLARLGKDLAFANFLPGVDISAKLTTWSRQPMAMGAFTHDKTMRDVELAGTMPILVPSIWFMYANRKLGITISEISAHYVRQGIVLEITVNYFNCLTAEDNIATLETQLDFAKTQYDRVSGLAKEELAAKWEAEQAFAIYKARETELAVAKRHLKTCQGELRRVMGLSPMGKLKLDRSGIEFDHPKESLESIVLTALQQHPSLSIADHNIVANENQVRAAICDFLPTLSGFANATWTSDSIASFNKNAFGGFAAAWNIFSGFANVANYKAAKTNKEAAMLDREATFLSVILEVVKAQSDLENAADTCELAEITFSAAKSKFTEYESKQKEGLVTLDDMLKALSEKDEAQAKLSLTKYRRQLALAALKMAMGTICGAWEDTRK